MKAKTTILSPSLEQYEVTELLGSGATGDVYKAIRYRDNQLVAIKFLKRVDYPSLVHFQRELWAYREFNNCPLIVNLLDCDLATDRPYLVLEFCTYGSAREKLDFLVSFPKTTLALVTHVAAALEEIHQRGCIYRDLKPDNLLLTNDGAGNLVMKLGDTGLICLPGEFGQFAATRTPAGTLPYMAPELFKDGNRYTRAAEVFALGVTVQELLTGVRPAPGTVISSGPIEVRTLIQNMIAAEPSARPTIREVRTELVRAHRLLARKDKITLTVLCGALIMLSLAFWLKPKK